jgi:tripeptide aminopeptidase
MVPETAADIERMARRPAVARARQLLRQTDDETLADLTELVAIPAPPFGEAARARRVLERFAEIGLLDPTLDAAGNVLARFPGARDGAAPVLLSAHLDTVFPEGTDLTLRRNGAKLYAPGIADDARGLAAILAIARALVRAGVRTRAPIVFVATVGEEGAGDLRGVKHLFREGSPWRRAAAFISLDGTGCRRIVHRALGSRRLRATVSGPGGHSWADWGIANPVHALATAITRLAHLELPPQPRTTLTVGRVAGGTGVNVIPDRAWCELDLRSEDPAALRWLERCVDEALRAAVVEANGRRRRGTRALTLEVEVIGDRPSGETPLDAALVRAARAATRFIGHTPELVASSTDANVPIALGIPAIAMGAGGESGGMHTLQEWYSNENGVEGLERALLTVLAVAGLAS